MSSFNVDGLFSGISRIAPYALMGGIAAVSAFTEAKNVEARARAAVTEQFMICEQELDRKLALLQENNTP